LLSGDTAVVSAGGGAFFDVVVDVLAGRSTGTRPLELLIRPGSYITHDDGLYADIAAFAQPGSTYSLQPALEIWGRVLSRPETELAFLDFGRRDVPFDQGLPTPHTVRNFDGDEPRRADGFEITALNDQHAYLRIPADDSLQVGDWVGCGVSHPCTAFDKWRYLPLVDDDYKCIGAVTTDF
jgi:D-serine deaminase-like pyridoxal phosphate-dependent protein